MTSEAASSASAVPPPSPAPPDSVPHDRLDDRLDTEPSDVPEVCPFCGETVTAPEPGAGTPRCRACLAFLDLQSRTVTQGHMGPWYLRDTARPHYPGVSWEVLAVLVARGEITFDSVIRGPGTGQLWMRAGRAPGVAHLVGRCHVCGAAAHRTDQRCKRCGVAFPGASDRDRLGLPGADGAPQRISAFASDDELRVGAPHIAAPATIAAAPAPPSPDDGLTPLELSLGHEIASERRKTRWLFAILGFLLVMDVALAIVVLMSKVK